MQLHEKIKHYYLDHIDELDTDKQFHLFTRLAAWEGDLTALQGLKKLTSTIVPANSEMLRQQLTELIEHPPTARINASELREEYFQKYPRLRGIDFALFRVRHLLAVYGVDARQTLLSLVPLAELEQLRQALTNDPAAMRTLSTYAINYLYLLERVILEHDDQIDIAALHDLGKAYDSSDPQQLQLYIYLYTHCIIGESNFYTRTIPAGLLPSYQAMVRDLEAVIQQHYDHINLDNKLEFLTCCRIVGYTTGLTEQIYDECARSVSDNGTYLVDRHNANAQSDKTSLADSEHRNVLFIMSKTTYSPHTTLVT
jgi:hypothetical protein